MRVDAVASQGSGIWVLRYLSPHSASSNAHPRTSPWPWSDGELGRSDLREQKAGRVLLVLRSAGGTLTVRPAFPIAHPKCRPECRLQASHLSRLVCLPCRCCSSYYRMSCPCFFFTNCPLPPPLTPSTSPTSPHLALPLLSLLASSNCSTCHSTWLSSLYQLPSNSSSCSATEFASPEEDMR